MTTGIYKLNFSNTKKVYIGQSLNIEERYSSHIRTMKDRTAARKLLLAYDTYGIPTLEILQIVENIEELNPLETTYISKYNAVDAGFNYQKIAGDMPRLYGEDHPGARYSNSQIEEVFLLLFEEKLTHQKIADITKVSKNMVNSVAAGSCHIWLRNLYPEKYKQFFESKKLYGTSAERNKVYPDIKSPEGKVYSITNIRKFARDNLLPYSSLNSLLNFRTNSTKGWERA